MDKIKTYHYQLTESEAKKIKRRKEKMCSNKKHNPGILYLFSYQTKKVRAQFCRDSHFVQFLTMDDITSYY